MRGVNGDGQILAITVDQNHSSSIVIEMGIGMEMEWFFGSCLKVAYVGMKIAYACEEGQCMLEGKESTPQRGWHLPLRLWMDKWDGLLG